jgi:hypothetical protein
MKKLTRTSCPDHFCETLPARYCDSLLTRGQDLPRFGDIQGLRKKTTKKPGTGDPNVWGQEECLEFPGGKPTESNHTKVVVVTTLNGNRNKGRIRLDCVRDGGFKNERYSGSGCDYCSRSGERRATCEAAKHSPSASGGPPLFSVAVSIEQRAAFLQWDGFRCSRACKPR